MRKAIINATLAGVLLCGATVASAQDTAQGRGFGTTLDIGGTNAVTQGDTGLKNAPNPSNTPSPNAFDGSAGPATLPAAPLIEAITGPSRTRGCSSGTGCPELFPTPAGSDPLDPTLSDEVFTHSTGGDATVSLLPAAIPGGTDVLNAVTSGASATVSCSSPPVGSSHVDALLIGARSMHNTPLLRAAGRSGLPVILKRGMSATYDELLAAAQYLTVEGNDQVILCERGIRTFETSTRNTLDLSAITVLRERTDLPIAIDPSHATGNAAWVPSLAVAAVAAGADALLVECHPEPHNSLCDAAQAITPATLDEIVRACDVLAPLTRPMALGGVAATRQAIDALDGVLIRLIEQRAGLVRVVQGHKRTAQLPPRDSKREGEIVERLHEIAPSLGRTRVRNVVRAVIDTCLESAHDADEVSAALKLNEDIA